MVTTVTTEAELNAALAANSDDIIFGNDITITSENEYVFSHKINGNLKTLTLNVTQSTSHTMWLKNFTGELHHLKVTGTIGLSNTSSTTALSCFVLFKSGGSAHDIIVQNLTFTGDLTAATMWSLFSNENSSGATLEDVWYDSLVYSNTGNTGRIFLIGKNVTVNRISISNISSMYVVNPNASVLTNGYMYNCQTTKAPQISGSAFRGASGSNALYVNTNCVIYGSLTESDREGRYNNSPNWTTLGFTAANGWNTVNGYPEYSFRTITVTGSHTVPLGMASSFEATDSEGTLTNFSWDFGDGTTLSGGAIVTHVYESAGSYTVTASGGGAAGSFTARAITVTITGDEHFVNGVYHTITAVGTLTSEGTYTWSDGTIGAAHTKMYEDYDDGDVINLTVTYTVDGVDVIRSITLVCVKGTLSIVFSSLTPSVDSTIDITTSYSGSEIPTSQALKHSTDGQSWTDLTPYSSPYSYTFSDISETTHYFKYVVTTPIEGTIESTSSVTTTTRGVIILSPDNNDNIFTGFDIEFIASTIGITNPSYLWSDGHTTNTFTKSFTTQGSVTMSVTVTGDEGSFSASVNLNVMNRGDIVISAPQTFSNGLPVTFTASTSLNASVTWSFPDSTTLTGMSVSKTFSGYNKGDVINVNVTSVFTDDENNSYTTTHQISLTCAYPRSYYENARGEKFYFDESCRILREGKSGFSEIQINTDIFSSHDYNSVAGLTVNNRAITFNVFVKGNYATMHAKRRQMVHIMAPQKELGTFYYTRDDGEVFSMKCNIALGYPAFSDEALKGGWVGTLSFIAPNGIWEGMEVSASTSSSINNAGDIPCGFSTTLTNNLLNSTNSEGMEANTGTLSGYKVDTAKGIVLKQSGGVWVNAWADVSLNSTLVRLEVGNNTITGCSSITFKPLYLGV